MATATIPTLTLDVSAPETVALGTRPNVTLTVTNAGEGMAPFGSLNRVEPAVA